MPLAVVIVLVPGAMFLKLEPGCNHNDAFQLPNFLGQCLCLSSNIFAESQAFLLTNLREGPRAFLGRVLAFPLTKTSMI